MKNLIFILMLLFCSTLLYTQVNIDYQFALEEIEDHDYIRNIWMDDLDGDGEDEIYTQYCNGYLGNWKIRCTDLSGNEVWTFIQDFPNEYAYVKKAKIIKYNNISYLIVAYCRSEQQGYDYDVFFDLAIYEWDDFSLIDSLSIYIGYGIWNESYNFEINSINLIEINSELRLYIGLKTIHSWGDEYEGFSESRYDKLIIYSFDNLCLNFIESIPHSGYHNLFYGNYENIISFGYYFHSHTDMGGNYSSSSSQYLNLISYDIPASVEEIRNTDNSTLGFISRNDFNFLDYGLTVLLSDEDNDYWYQAYSTDFNSTNWVSYDLGMIEDNCSYTSHTCISTNLGDNYIMSFGKPPNIQPKRLEIRDRLTGNIVHSQNSPIAPEYIIRTNNDSIYFFENYYIQGYFDHISVYKLVEEIQVSVNENELPITSYDLQNYPNPFNPSTTISFSLNTEDISDCKMIIYNLKGQKVKEFDIFLSEDEGESNSIVWYGTDQNNKYVSSGIYFYQLKVNEEIKQTKKMILLK